MRHRPTDPSRRPRPTPSEGIDESRAGAREIDCGESPKDSIAGQRGDAAPRTEDSAPGSGLGEQPQAV